jgi:hypothetical protein
MSTPTPLAGQQAARTRTLVMWLIWSMQLGALLVIYLLLGRGPLPPAAANPFENLVGLVPLFVSIVLRWLVLPRSTEPGRALVVLIAGCALAEACGVLGIFLGGPYRDDLVLLAALGIAQFVPFYAKRLGEPKPEGFIPNN